VDAEAETEAVEALEEGEEEEEEEEEEVDAARAFASLSFFSLSILTDSAMIRSNSCCSISDWVYIFSAEGSGRFFE